MLTKRDVQILGWVYGTISNEIEKNHNGKDVFTTPAMFEKACANPMVGFTLIMQYIVKNGIGSIELDKTIAPAIDELDTSHLDDLPAVSPTELQGVWLVAYYKAKNGSPLPPMYMDLFEIKKIDIAELRKSAGYTQIQLAEALGIVQAVVSNWENGKSCPSAKQVQQIMEMCKPNK